MRLSSCPEPPFLGGPAVHRSASYLEAVLCAERACLGRLSDHKAREACGHVVRFELLHGPLTRARVSSAKGGLQASVKAGQQTYPKRRFEGVIVGRDAHGARD